jgi:hypothetical protein
LFVFTLTLTMSAWQQVAPLHEQAPKVIELCLLLRQMARMVKCRKI